MVRLRSLVYLRGKFVRLVRLGPRSPEARRRRASFYLHPVERHLPIDHGMDTAAGFQDRGSSKVPQGISFRPEYGTVDNHHCLGGEVSV